MTQRRVCAGALVAAALVAASAPVPASAARAALAPPARVTASLPRPNVRVNDVSGDSLGDAQCEPSIAALQTPSGILMLAAWNDGAGLRDGSGQVVGWGTSTDGGLTWVDRGTLPVPAGHPQWHWSGSPVVAVDARTGAFYCAALADASPTTSAIGVLRGHFTGPAPGALAWDPPVVARAVGVATDVLVQPWLAVDSTSHVVQLVELRQTGGVGRIEAQHADSLLGTWSAPVEISDVTERGRVARPRNAVGAGGVVYVAYFVTGLVDADEIRTARSPDDGATWAPAVDAVSVFSNPDTGPPGDNASQAVQYASLALEGPGGTNPGRLHLAWSESLDWYDDLPTAGDGAPASEVEPDDVPANATPAGVGAMLRGTIASAGDVDCYALTLAAGQGVVVALDSLSTGMRVGFSLLAPDGATRLCSTQGSDEDLVPGYLPPAWIFTAPVAGTYTVRVTPVAGTGDYAVATGATSRTGERGRDQRDVFSACSDDGGATWSTPVLVSDSPVGHDDALPEIASADDGGLYCAWLDGRDAPVATAGGVLSTCLARSDDGGATWETMGATSDTSTNWTHVTSDLVPNLGDHIALIAGGFGLVACWSDGRGGSPDVELAYWTLHEGQTPTLLALVSCTAQPDRVELAWYADQPALEARLERSVNGGAWSVLASLVADGDGQLRYTDRDVTPGSRYAYRLAVSSAGAVTYWGRTSALVPATLTLALSAPRPNPARGAPALDVDLPLAAPATLAIFDVAGRRVAARSLSAPSPGRMALVLDEATRLPAGAYVVRLTQGDRSASTSVRIVR
ncbi:MAG TPA: hypothetical protein VMH61_01610 [Candidatus Acidoferrales bacterium]|nr:hypothetical protein [Candidatus Acidoferrales bacterium]